MAINVTADTLYFASTIRAGLSSSTAPTDGVSLTYRCNGYDSAGVAGQGILKFNPTITGTWLNVNVTGLLSFAPTIDGEWLDGFTAGADTILAFNPTISGVFWIGYPKSNWVIKSKPGHMDFTLGIDKQAWEAPMPWKGWVYQILKCGTFPVVFGENGITLLQHQGTDWGVKTIHNKGLKGKGAAVACGPADEPNYLVFIDRAGCLGVISPNGQVQITDYSTYLSALTTAVVMLYDPLWNWVYICDGSVGYVWTESGLGRGPKDLTGIGYQSGTSYALCPGTLATDPLNICVDTMDFGFREAKTITQVSLGTNLINDGYVAVDYRWNKGDSFTTSPWTKVDRFGNAYVLVSGVEFRLRVKLLAYENIQLDRSTIIVSVADSVIIPGGA